MMDSIVVYKNKPEFILNNNDNDKEKYLYPTPNIDSLLSLELANVVSMIVDFWFKKKFDKHLNLVYSLTFENRYIVSAHISYFH